eukprot:m.2834 g.2834  ORF g.2834 m.2834 type:complete len:51 (+) comp1949_c0_seq1:19-171(+)
MWIITVYSVDTMNTKGAGWIPTSLFLAIVLILVIRFLFPLLNNFAGKFLA